MGPIRTGSRLNEFDSANQNVEGRIVRMGQGQLGTLFSLSSLLLGASLVGCGDDDGDAPFGGPDAEDLYLIHYTNQTLDGITSFIAAVPGLDASQSVDPQSTLEVSGFVGLLAPQEANGTFFVALSESPEIVRYEARQDGALVETGRVSYAGVGASSGNFMLRPAYFQAPDRAFFVVPEALRVVIWNPEAMIIEGEIPLTGLAPPDGLGPRIFDSTVDEGRLIIPAGYARQNLGFDPLGRLAIVDLATLDVTYAEQNRCGWPTLSLADPAGNLYFASHPAQGSAFAAGVTGSPTFPPCLVRLRSGANEFDPDYFVDLTTLVGRPTASVAPATGGRAYVTISPRGIDEFTPENFADLRGAADWEVHIFEPGNEGSAVSRATNAPTTADQIFSGLVDIDDDDGRPIATPLVNISTEDFSQTTIYDVSDVDNWIPGIVVPGYTYNIVRIR